ncbi:hypothetical protein PF005_g17905 [Phytophthora fragariae]|nr:hypothetical protein PF005_g17905 [Phytophthora fragariae]
MVRLLLEQGAEFSKRDLDGRTALDYAEKSGDAAIATPIAGHQRSLQLKLFHAAKQGDVEQLRAALKKVKNVDIRDDRGNPLLLLAAAEGHSEAVQVLLDSNVDVNARREDGRTALMLAAEQGNRNIARVLLRSGAEVNTLDLNGASPMLLAVRERHEEMVLLLRSSGVDIDAASEEGKTPLIQTIIHNDVNSTRMLLGHEQVWMFPTRREQHHCCRLLHLETTRW